MASRLSLAPSLRLQSAQWPIHGLWAFNMAGGPKPQGRSEDVVILRAEFDPEPFLLPAGGHAFLSALLAGETLGRAYEAGLAVTQEFDLSALLTLLISHSALEGRMT